MPTKNKSKKVGSSFPLYGHSLGILESCGTVNPSIWCLGFLRYLGAQKWSWCHRLPTGCISLTSAGSVDIWPNCWIPGSTIYLHKQLPEPTYKPKRAIHAFTARNRSREMRWILLSKLPPYRFVRRSKSRQRAAASQADLTHCQCQACKEQYMGKTCCNSSHLGGTASQLS